jgi:DNA-binding transcriptional ArsR family regulator
VKPISSISDPRLVKAIAHPIRLRILAELESGMKSPTEVAASLDASVGTVAYHFRQLASLGLIKLAKRTPRRGAVEHHYRLERRPQVSDEAWAAAPPFVKEAFLRSMLGQVSEQVNAAAAGGGFDRSDAFGSRVPLTLDEQGFADVAKELDAVVARLQEIERESRKRLRKADHDGEIDTRAVLMLFESRPDPDATKPPKRARGGRAGARRAGRG